MPKFRSISVEKEAVQLTENNILEVYSFIHGKPDLSSRIAEDKWADYENLVRESGLRLKTLESDGETQKADIGDWIIRGIHGEFYPCKPDIFEKSYRPVSQPDKHGMHFLEGIEDAVFGDHPQSVSFGDPISATWIKGGFAVTVRVGKATDTEKEVYA
jgi:hypothetical protein